MKSKGPAGAAAGAASIAARAAVCIGDEACTALASGADETVVRAAIDSDCAGVVVNAATFGAAAVAAVDGSTLPNVVAGAGDVLWLFVAAAGSLGPELATRGSCDDADGVPTTGAVADVPVSADVDVVLEFGWPAGGELMLDDAVLRLLDVVVLLSAPPELRMTTAGPVVLVVLVSDGDVPRVVVPDLGVVSVVVLPDADTVDEGDETDALPNPVVVPDDVVFAVLVPAVLASPELELVDAPLSDSGFAHAIAGELATAIPTPSATASAPTRPM